MSPRLVAALLLTMTVAAAPLAAQPTPTPDAAQREREERLRIHEVRVKAILAERKRQRMEKMTAPQTATSGTASNVALSPDRQARLEAHIARTRAILAERRLQRTLGDPEAAASWRAETATRRQQFETTARGDKDLMAVATQVANARVDPTGATPASAEQVEQELKNALERVFKREDRFLEGKPPLDLSRAVTVNFKDADTDEVSKVFAENGVRLSFEGATRQARLSLAGNDMAAGPVLMALAREAGGKAWLLADDAVLFTDGEPPAGAIPLFGKGSSREDMPELADPTGSDDLAREALRLSTLLYSEYLAPGSTKQPLMPPVAPAPPVDPPLDSPAVFTAS